jgi:Flp pilus assembly protein TadD
MTERPAVDVERLQYDCRWALSNGLGARDLVPMLERLDRCAPPDSDAALFAKAQLAELIVDRDPWRAATLCRAVLGRVDSDRAWGVLGLAYTLLGHYRAAAHAYRRALALEPKCVSYAHNLGHLLDMALGRPRDAVRLLADAHRALPDEVEIAGSYAHALLHAGKPDAARQVLTAAMGSKDAAESMLERWGTRPDRQTGRPSDP